MPAAVLTRWRGRWRGRPLTCVLLLAALWAPAVLVFQGGAESQSRPPRRAALLLAAAAAAALPAPEAALAERRGFTTSPSGLQSRTMRKGAGDLPVTGDKVFVQYTGWLEDFNSPNTFDSSRGPPGTSAFRGKPFKFALGKGEVIAGWEEAISGMKVGEKRLLIVPPQLAYGKRGNDPVPPDATLFFEVELEDIIKPS
mmetsp:Transcript_68656/g.147088  ORF Transcript_68656/g.147088 Transcript_68656/m.147088 type:complete len:198 (+) Transcript_68656:68-661(+)